MELTVSLMGRVEFVPTRMTLEEGNIGEKPYGLKDLSCQDLSNRNNVIRKEKKQVEWNKQLS